MRIRACQLIYRIILAALAALSLGPRAFAGWDENFAAALEGFMNIAHGHPERAAPLLLQAARSSGQTDLFAQAAKQSLQTNDLRLLSTVSNEWYASGGGVPALSLYANAVIRRDGYPSAANILSQIARSSDARDVYSAIASALPRGRDSQSAASAIAAMKGAYEDKYRDATYWSHLALLFVYGRDIKGATAAAENALRSEPNNADGLMVSIWLVDAASDQGKAKKIMLVRALADKLEAEIGDVLVAYQHWKADFKRSYAALPASYEGLLATSPGEAKFRAGSFLLAHDDPAGALEQLGTPDYRSPLIEVDLDLRIEILARLNRENDIDAILKEALASVAPSHIVPLARIAAHRVEKQAGSDAAYRYLKDIYVPVQISGLVDLTAQYAQRAGHFDEAEAMLRILIVDMPDDAGPLNSLGYMFADNNTNLDEAFILLSRAVELEPQEPAIADSMGWLMYRRGNYPEALKQIKRSAEIFERNRQTVPGEVIAHLGEVYWATGQRARAIAIWQRGLKETPRDEVLLKTISRFNAFDI